ncbi:MAG: hypothetical protein JXR40_05415 [Pontiellaceae bacterium]|nr:hypothetical protein [Pontiellaceae bacterium]
MKKLITLSWLLVVLTGCKSLEPIQSGANDASIHSYSQVVYPPNLGAFSRGQLNLYDAEGKDVSYGYNLMSRDDHVAVTIYSYPAPKLVSIGSRKSVVLNAKRLLFNQQSSAEIQDILNYNRPAELVESRAVENRMGTSEIDGLYAQFRYQEILGMTRNNVLSELYLFQKDKWLIKYRITYPAVIEEKAKKLIETLMLDHVSAQAAAGSRL